ncbi:MAG: hypothetical protein CMH41_02385, partial [Micrococcales bacterium]|nr:hypothetical protein [Micrococcales bacterium]
MQCHRAKYDCDDLQLPDELDELPEMVDLANLVRQEASPFASVNESARAFSTSVNLTRRASKQESDCISADPSARRSDFAMPVHEQRDGLACMASLVAACAPAPYRLADYTSCLSKTYLTLRQIPDVLTTCRLYVELSGGAAVVLGRSALSALQPRALPPMLLRETLEATHVRVRGAGGTSGPLVLGQNAWLYSGPNRRHRAVLIVGVNIRGDAVPPIELYKVTEWMLNDVGRAVRSNPMEVPRSQLEVVEPVLHRFEPGKRAFHHVSMVRVAAQLLEIKSSGERIPGYLIARGDGCLEVPEVELAGSPAVLLRSQSGPADDDSSQTSSRAESDIPLYLAPPLEMLFRKRAATESDPTKLGGYQLILAAIREHDDLRGCFNSTFRNDLRGVKRAMDVPSDSAKLERAIDLCVSEAINYVHRNGTIVAGADGAATKRSGPAVFDRGPGATRHKSESLGGQAALVGGSCTPTSSVSPCGNGTNIGGVVMNLANHQLAMSRAMAFGDPTVQSTEHALIQTVRAMYGPNALSAGGSDRADVLPNENPFSYATRDADSTSGSIGNRDASSVPGSGGSGAADFTSGSTGREAVAGNTGSSVAISSEGLILADGFSKATLSPMPLRGESLEDHSEEDDFDRLAVRLAGGPFGLLLDQAVGDQAYWEIWEDTTRSLLRTGARAAGHLMSPGESLFGAVLVRPSANCGSGLSHLDIQVISLGGMIVLPSNPDFGQLVVAHVLALGDQWSRANLLKSRWEIVHVVYECLTAWTQDEEYRLPGLRGAEIPKQLLIIARCDYVRLHSLLASAVLLRPKGRARRNDLDLEPQHCLLSRYTHKCNRRQGWDGINFCFYTHYLRRRMCKSEVRSVACVWTNVAGGEGNERRFRHFGWCTDFQHQRAWFDPQHTWPTTAGPATRRFVHPRIGMSTATEADETLAIDRTIQVPVPHALEVDFANDWQSPCPDDPMLRIGIRYAFHWTVGQDRKLLDTVVPWCVQCYPGIDQGVIVVFTALKHEYRWIQFQPLYAVGHCCSSCHQLVNLLGSRAGDRGLVGLVDLPCGFVVGRVAGRDLHTYATRAECYSWIRDAEGAVASHNSEQGLMSQLFVRRVSDGLHAVTDCSQYGQFGGPQHAQYTYASMATMAVDHYGRAVLTCNLPRPGLQGLPPDVARSAIVRAVDSERAPIRCGAVPVDASCIEFEEGECSFATVACFHTAQGNARGLRDAVLEHSLLRLLATGDDTTGLCQVLAYSGAVSIHSFLMTLDFVRKGAVVLFGRKGIQWALVLTPPSAEGVCEYMPMMVADREGEPRITGRKALRRRGTGCLHLMPIRSRHPTGTNWPGPSFASIESARLQDWLRERGVIKVIDTIGKDAPTMNSDLQVQLGCWPAGLMLGGLTSFDGSSGGGSSSSFPFQNMPTNELSTWHRAVIEAHRWPDATGMLMPFSLGGDIVLRDHAMEGEALLKTYLIRAMRIAGVNGPNSIQGVISLALSISSVAGHVELVLYECLPQLGDSCRSRCSDKELKQLVMAAVYLVNQAPTGDCQDRDSEGRRLPEPLWLRKEGIRALAHFLAHDALDNLSETLNAYGAVIELGGREVEEMRRRTGPDHCPRFSVVITLDGRTVSKDAATLIGARRLAASALLGPDRLAALHARRVLASRSSPIDGSVSGTPFGDVGVAEQSLPSDAALPASSLAIPEPVIDDERPSVRLRLALDEGASLGGVAEGSAAAGAAPWVLDVVGDHSLLEAVPTSALPGLTTPAECSVQKLYYPPTFFRRNQIKVPDETGWGWFVRKQDIHRILASAHHLDGLPYDRTEAYIIDTGNGLIGMVCLVMREGGAAVFCSSSVQDSKRRALASLVPAAHRWITSLRPSGPTTPMVTSTLVPLGDAPPSAPPSPPGEVFDVSEGGAVDTAARALQRRWRYRRQVRLPGHARYIRRVGGGGRSGVLGDATGVSRTLAPWSLAFGYSMGLEFIGVKLRPTSLILSEAPPSPLPSPPNSLSSSRSVTPTPCYSSEEEIDLDPPHGLTFYASDGMHTPRSRPPVGVTGHAFSSHRVMHAHGSPWLSSPELISLGFLARRKSDPLLYLDWSPCGGSTTTPTRLTEAQDQSSGQAIEQVPKLHDNDDLGTPVWLQEAAAVLASLPMIQSLDDVVVTTDSSPIGKSGSDITELLKGLAEVRSGLNQTAAHKAWLLQAESKELQDLCLMLGCCEEAILPASDSSLNFECASVGWLPKTVCYERSSLMAPVRAPELMLSSVSVALDLVKERLPLVLVPGHDGGRLMPASKSNLTSVLIAAVLAAAGDANGLPSCSYCRHAGLVEGDHQCESCNGVCLRLALDGEWTILDCEKITQELEDQLREAITLVMRTLDDLNRSNESFTRSLTLRGILRALNEPSQLGLLNEVTQELTGLALANELLMSTLGVFMNDLTEIVRSVREVFLELPELCEEVYQPRLAPLLMLIHGRLIGAFHTSRDESTHAQDIYREHGQLSAVANLVVSTHVGSEIVPNSAAAPGSSPLVDLLVNTLLVGRCITPRLSYQMPLPCLELPRSEFKVVPMRAWSRRYLAHMIACSPCCLKRQWPHQTKRALEHHPVITVRGSWQVHPSSGRMSDDAWNLLRYLTDDLCSLKDASDMTGFIEFLFYWRFVPAALHELLIEAAEPWMQAARDVELYGLEWASGLSDGWPLKGMRVGYFGPDGAALCLYDERLLVDRGDLRGWSQPSPPLGGPPFMRVTDEIEWPSGGSESLGDYWYQCRERSTCAPRGYITCGYLPRSLARPTRRRSISSAYRSILIRFVLEDRTAEAVTKIQRAWRYRRQTKGAGHARYIRRVGGGGGSAGDSSVPSSDSTPPVNPSEQAPSAAEVGIAAACADEAGGAAPAGATAPAGDLPATLASACCASGGTLPEPTRPMRTASRSSSSRRRAAPAGDDRLWVAGDFGRAPESKLLAGATPFATPAPLASSRKEHPGRAQGPMPAPPIGWDAVPRVPSIGDELQPAGILRSPSIVKPAMSPSRSGDLRPVDPSDLGLHSAFASAIAMRNRCSISASIQPVAAKGLAPGASLPHTPTGSRSAADGPGGQPGSGASERPGSGGGHTPAHENDFADEEDEADDPDDEDDDDPEDGDGPYRGRSGGWLPPQRTSRDELRAN